MTPRRRLALLSAALLLIGLSPASGEDLSSASYRLRGANFNAGAAAAMQSTAPEPRFESRGVSLGQSVAIGFAAAAGSLRSAAPGFWPIVAGAFPTLDVDGDLLPAFADTDDDGDGLLDSVETNTGTFVQSSALAARNYADAAQRLLAVARDLTALAKAAAVIAKPIEDSAQIGPDSSL